MSPKSAILNFDILTHLNIIIIIIYYYYYYYYYYILHWLKYAILSYSYTIDFKYNVYILQFRIQEWWSSDSRPSCLPTHSNCLKKNKIQMYKEGLKSQYESILVVTSNDL